jgi:hypothetical protein
MSRNIGQVVSRLDVTLLDIVSYGANACWKYLDNDAESKVLLASTVVNSIKYDFPGFQPTNTQNSWRCYMFGCYSAPQPEDTLRCTPHANRQIQEQQPPHTILNMILACGNDRAIVFEYG